MTPNEKPSRIIRTKEVLERTGLTLTTLYREIDAGRFPPQVRLTTSTTGFHESEVEAWMESRQVVAGVEG